MKLIELKEKKLTELKEIAKTMNIKKASSMSKDELLKAITSLEKKNLDDGKKEIKKEINEQITIRCQKPR